MYTGKIQLDYATVIPLVSLADKYNVKDLLRLGLDYMARNVSTAAKKHQIVTWYQFATVAGHRRVAELTGNFIKWNFEVVSKTLDYSSLDLPQLIQFLEANDLVICKSYIAELQYALNIIYLYFIRYEIRHIITLQMMR